MNKKYKRAMNRIRKREVELALLNNQEQKEEYKVETKKQKLDEEGVQSVDQDSLRTTACELAEDLLERARDLSRDLRAKLAGREQKREFVVKPVLQLFKLQGRPLSEREIAAFLHKMMLGSHNCSQVCANWMRFDGGKKPLQIVFIRINAGDKEMLHRQDGANFMDGYFKYWIKLAWSATDRIKFWQSISTVMQSKYDMLLKKITTCGDPILNIRLPERKAQLLMSFEQMLRAKYPLPTDDAPTAGEVAGIRSTRRIYHRVTEKSPIFTVDCEMCRTSVAEQELTRISVVDENGVTVMDELVKPHNKIIDYITFKSGITEKMLRNVFTRLKDIQHRLCGLLPADAILCGHSLENDLRALKLSHPFCIDTSLLFNFSGRLHIRSGLKALAKIFLNTDIQNSKNGHCSLQDAQTTWRLLKLKLEKGIKFGNVAFGWNFANWAKENGMSITGTRLIDPTTDKTFEIKLENDSQKVDEQDNTFSLKDCCIDASVSSSTCDDVLIDARIGVQLDSELIKNEEENKEMNLAHNNPTFVNFEQDMIAVVFPEEMGKLASVNENEGNCNEEGPFSIEKFVKEELRTSDEKMNPESAEGKVENEESVKNEEEEGQNIYNPEEFNFEEALRIENCMQRSVSLSECFRQVNTGGKKSRKMLVAMNEPKNFFTSNNCCKLIDLSVGDGIAASTSAHQTLVASSTTTNTLITAAESSKSNMFQICDRIAGELINYDFAFLELNCPSGFPKRELDEAFARLTEGVCNNALVLCLLANDTKKGQAILYEQVHRKKVD